MKLISKQNRRGFSLIEVMVAIVILMVGSLGLLEVITMSFRNNLQNQRREEVGRVADEVINNMWAQPFDATFSPTTTVTSKLRDGSVSYRVSRNVTDITAGSTRRYIVDVRWRYGSYSASHSVSSVRSKGQ